MTFNNHFDDKNEKSKYRRGLGGQEIERDVGIEQISNEPGSADRNESKNKTNNYKT